MGLFKELDRQDRGQAAEDVEVVPLNDVSHGRGDDNAPEVLRDFRASHTVLLRYFDASCLRGRGLAGPPRSEACVSLGLRGTLLRQPPNAYALRINSPPLVRSLRSDVPTKGAPAVPHPLDLCAA